MEGQIEERNEYGENAALLQLVAFGSQDLYLKDSSGKKLFYPKYNKHTNFSTSTFKQKLQNHGSSFKFGSKYSCKLESNYDLAEQISLVVKLPILKQSNLRYKNKLGFRIIKKISYEVGGMRFDTLYGSYIHHHNILKNTLKSFFNKNIFFVL